MQGLLVLALVVCLAMVTIYGITIQRSNSKVGRYAINVTAILVVCLVFVMAVMLNPDAAEVFIKTVGPLFK